MRTIESLEARAQKMQEKAEETLRQFHAKMLKLDVDRNEEKQIISFFVPHVSVLQARSHSPFTSSKHTHTHTHTLLTSFLTPFPCAHA